MIAKTESERMALIKKIAEKFNKKVKRNSRVRRTETLYQDKYDQGNIHHYTDASKYAEQYYGERFRQTTGLDNQWD
tara:strand:+ start:474 stop:701 length:228 start_codon:yes stop_codon:yes gene_type:complete